MSETISKFGHGGARANSGGARPGAGRPRKIEPPAVFVPIVSRWCVYQTYPQAERIAAEDLTRMGYRGYAPLIAVRKKDPVLSSMFHKVQVPRFPGYGFVELGPGESWLPVLGADGVAGLLRRPDGRPSRVPAGEIERHMLDDERLCDLQPETMPAFVVGDRVVILHGALAGRAGSVLECDGLVTMVEVEMFLGRTLPIRLDRAAVEPAG